MRDSQAYISKGIIIVAHGRNGADGEVDVLGVSDVAVGGVALHGVVSDEFEEADRVDVGVGRLSDVEGGVHVGCVGWAIKAGDEFLLVCEVSKMPQSRGAWDLRKHMVQSRSRNRGTTHHSGRGPHQRNAPELLAETARIISACLGGVCRRVPEKGEVTVNPTLR